MSLASYVLKSIEESFSGKFQKLFEDKFKLWSSIFGKRLSKEEDGDPISEYMFDAYSPEAVDALMSLYYKSSTLSDFDDDLQQNLYAVMMEMLEDVPEKFDRRRSY